MTPQESYPRWKQKQGLPVSGTDVTDGDTVQPLPTTPAEEAIKTAMMRHLWWQHQADKS